ncbi:putative CCR4-associated factor 1-like protein 11 [Iris pallida]|uniref:poly(A)-specific ribonuclease n=1 Tax=Iris pallida TaxID=29817 RepID=A0AAX6EHI2_IRIPA|nr:putative CCR4-associated factor 1-like protein 11 [Iris pallida]
MPSDSQKPKIKIRSVWAHNLESEFKLISNCVRRYPFASMDTEFPGVVYRPRKHHSLLSPSDRYSLLKYNVDSLNLIQLGLTLSDSDGNLPNLGSNRYSYIWEFNFSDFNIYRDSCAPDSIQLLRANGIDFERNVAYGIDSRRFATLLMRSGLLFNSSAAAVAAPVSWITFHSAYDFGYLIKILTRRKLPHSLGDFMSAVRFYFGEKGFLDVKCVMRHCDGLFGGLERVAGTLRVERVAGKSHQAGSDSLLTWQSFLRMKEVFCLKDGGKEHAGVLFGLEVC